MTPIPTTRMANAIRALAMDAVQKANSGHPGMPMGMAEIAVALWHEHLRHNPADPGWFNRDRFVLSNGHGSMLQYALLHLTGYDLPMDQLRAFRQLHSRTPGHPERGITPGVETTTGPLGQGLANAVGMALAERLLAAEFNREDLALVDHHTYVFVGDGCMMEGVSHEAASLAGKWGLNKLIVFYDDNGISIDGRVEGWFTDDTPARFRAYGWNVIEAVPGHDVSAISRAIAAAKGARQPTLIVCKTVIGKGAPHLAGTDKVHGAALGEAEVAATRVALGWKEAPFEIGADLYAAWDARARGKEAQQQWMALLARYRKRHPEQAAEFERRMNGTLPGNWHELAAELVARTQVERTSVATRKASQLALNHLAPAVPELLGGSADLTGSNLTNWDKVSTLRVDGEGFHAGRYIHYGVREFGMAAIANGIVVHGGYIPFTGTFLTFSDYSRNALRMAALMKLRAIAVFTHDSIGLGEDGPTHQSVEHAASLRLIPNMDVWRPADTTETALAWISAVERADGPSSLLLSRQTLPYLDKSAAQLADIRRGAYVLKDARNARVVLIATGSEVALALAAHVELESLGIAARVVSMPSTSVFDRQEARYKTRVLPEGIVRLAIEAGVTDFWWKYVRASGAVIGIDGFGESAPADVLFRHFHFTVENVVATVRRLLA